MPNAAPTAGSRNAPGTATADTASGWHRVSTFTCWKALQAAVWRCLREKEIRLEKEQNKSALCLQMHSRSNNILLMYQIFESQIFIQVDFEYNLKNIFDNLV